MKKTLAALLALLLLGSVLLSGCNEKADNPPSTLPDADKWMNAFDWRTPADTALADLISHFWDSTGNHVVNTSQGFPAANSNKMLWELATMIFALDTYQRATGSDDVKQKIAAEWAYIKATYTQNQLIGGTFGTPPYIAIDDAGWAAMMFMICYRATGDMYALQCEQALIINAYAHWQNTDGGLLYDNSRSTVYLAAVGLLCAATDFMVTTGDQSLLPNTQAAVDFINNNMRRDGARTFPSAYSDGRDLTVTAADGLFWMGFNVNNNTANIVNGPQGGDTPNNINPTGSVSALFGNMGMAVIEARLYKITGDSAHLDRAVQNVNSLANSTLYNKNGAFINDRDAWANGSIVGWWVSEALPLPGVDVTARVRIGSTAKAILDNARTADGLYTGDWNGGSAWTKAGSTAQQIMTSSNTANMVMAAALLWAQN